MNWLVIGAAAILIYLGVGLILRSARAAYRRSYEEWRRDGGGRWQ